MIDMIDIIYIWIELEIGIELCDGIVWMNCVVLERSLVRNQESGVKQIRWRVEGGVLVSSGLDSMAAGVKCPGGSSPPKLFTWYDYDVIDIFLEIDYVTTVLKKLYYLSRDYLRYYYQDQKKEGSHTWFGEFKS